MKTTINILTVRYEKVRHMEQKENTTVKALVEGLRPTLAEHEQRVPFTLRKATFKGNGMQTEFADASWDKIRQTA